MYNPEDSELEENLTVSNAYIVTKSHKLSEKISFSRMNAEQLTKVEQGNLKFDRLLLEPLPIFLSPMLAILGTNMKFLNLSLKTVDPSEVACLFLLLMYAIWEMCLQAKILKFNTVGEKFYRVQQPLQKISFTWGNILKQINYFYEKERGLSECELFLIKQLFLIIIKTQCVYNQLKNNFTFFNFISFRMCDIHLPGNIEYQENILNPESKTLIPNEALIIFSFADQGPSTVKIKAKKKSEQLGQPYTSSTDSFFMYPSNIVSIIKKGIDSYFDMLADLGVETIKFNKNYILRSIINLCCQYYASSLQFVYLMDQKVKVFYPITLENFIKKYTTYAAYLSDAHYKPLKTLLSLFNYILKEKLNFMSLSWDCDNFNKNTKIFVGINIASIKNHDAIYSLDTSWCDAFTAIVRSKVEFLKNVEVWIPNFDPLSIKMQIADISTSEERLISGLTTFGLEVSYSLNTVNYSIFDTLFLRKIPKIDKNIFHNSLKLRDEFLAAVENFDYSKITNQEVDSTIPDKVSKLKTISLNFANAHFSAMSTLFCDITHKTFFSSFIYRTRAFSNYVRNISGGKKILSLENWLYPNNLTGRSRIIQSENIKFLGLTPNQYIFKNLIPSRVPDSNYTFEEIPLDFSAESYIEAGNNNTVSNNYKNKNEKNTKLTGIYCPGRSYEVPRSYNDNVNCLPFIALSNKLNFRILFQSHAFKKTINTNILVVDLTSAHPNIALAISKKVGILNPELQIPINWSSSFTRISNTFIVLAKKKFNRSYTLEFLLTEYNLSKKSYKKHMLALLNGRNLNFKFEQNESVFNFLVENKKLHGVKLTNKYNGFNPLSKLRTLKSEHWNNLILLNNIIRTDILSTQFSDFFNYIRNSEKFIFMGQPLNIKKLKNKDSCGYYVYSIIEGFLVDNLILDLTINPDIKLLALEFDGLSFSIPNNFDITSLKFFHYSMCCDKMLDIKIPLSLEIWKINEDLVFQKEENADESNSFDIQDSLNPDTPTFKQCLNTEEQELSVMNPEESDFLEGFDENFDDSFLCETLKRDAESGFYYSS
jgi:hypothetical protein